MKKTPSRKPKVFESDQAIRFASIEKENFGGLIYFCEHFEEKYMDAKEARKLAQWLIKAADYLDAKRSGK
jgi:hypothetical protein